LNQYRGNPGAVIAALLHDAVEDQGVTGAEIADLFGPTAASLVAE
jgi:(p)ppGpp synthase/HD superfamily hydrolase